MNDICRQTAFCNAQYAKTAFILKNGVIFCNIRRILSQYLAENDCLYSIFQSKKRQVKPCTAIHGQSHRTFCRFFNIICLRSNVVNILTPRTFSPYTFQARQIRTGYHKRFSRPFHILYIRRAFRERAYPTR